MNRIFPRALLTLLILGAGPACADVELTVDNGTVWQTDKAMTTTEGFAQIHNTGLAADILTQWTCPLADTTLLVGADGKPLLSLMIPAGQTLVLSTNGPHLVLEKTHYRVASISQVPCSLTFQNAGQVGVYLQAVASPNP